MPRRLTSLVTLAVCTGVFTACSAPEEDDAPATSVLHDETRMGLVALNVDDLATVRTYYEEGIGLSVLSESDDQTVLGLGDEPLIALTSHTGDQDPTEAGLYHSAILYPDEAALADALANLSPEAQQSFQGSSDHRVSQAFYFADPEGNGLELYADRPAAEWEWPDGQVTMGSAALDPNAFILEHATGGPRPERATMGHVHLRVGDIEQAERFYVDDLGFAVTSRTDDETALFMSAGGYHHHLAANVWNSSGAGTRTAELGLREFTVVLPDSAELDSTVDRIEDAGHEVERDADAARVLDPWGNLLVLTVDG